MKSTASAPIDPTWSAQRVLEWCDQQGFAHCGIAPASPIEHHRALIEWLNAGRHGEMTYLDEHLAQRIDPRKKLVGAKSIICVADRYASGHGEDETTGPRQGRVARYARGDDYHRVMKDRLHQLCDLLARECPDHRFVACVDTAPVLEREHARRAGIGYVGKNTMLIEPGIGSYLLLGEIITTLPLSPNEGPHGDHCGTCTRCIDACPTQAITPWSVDATACLSYHTIELRGPIDEAFHEAMGDWMFGCDICQEVCPHNGPTPRTESAPTHEAYHPRHSAFDLLDLLGWSEEDRRAKLTRSAIKRAKLWMLKRNALIVAGNWLARQSDAALVNRIVELARDEREHEVVRMTAAQVLRRIESSLKEV